MKVTTKPLEHIKSNPKKQIYSSKHLYLQIRNSTNDLMTKLQEFGKMKTKHKSSR